MSSAIITPINSKVYSGFDPRQISGCALWLDAADSSSFTLSGNNVATIRDKSGTKTVTVTSTPTYNSTIFNGRPAFVFASGTRFSVTTTALGQNLSLIGVFRVTGFTGASGNAVPIAVGTPGSGTETGMGWNATNSVYNFYDSNLSDARSSTVTTIDVNLVQVGVKSSTSPNLITSVNGTLGGTTATSTYSNANTTINVGNAGTNFGFLGNIAEVIVYSTALSTTQRQQIEGYLAWKWGLQTNLPASHPYKNFTVFTRVFSPLDIPGCALWFDAADLSTITTSTGSNVSTLVNKAGGPNATSFTGGGTVTTGSTAINGRNTIRIADGSALSISNYVVTTPDISIFYVIRGVSSIGNSGYFVTYAQTNYVYSSVYNLLSTSTTFTVYVRSGVAENAFTITPQTALLNTPGMISVVKFAGFLNGNSLSAYNTATNIVGSTGTITYYLGAPTSLRGDGRAFDLGEVVVYQADLAASQRQQVESYLAWKWGLRGNLPATHPFRLYNVLTPVFSPTQIANLSLWLDAADSSSFTLSGSSVSQWNDKSGNSDNAVQASASLQPTYTNLSVVFDGISQYMTLAAPSTLPSGATPLGTYFFVTKLTTSSAVQVFFMYGPNTLTTGANPQFYYNASSQLVVDTFGAGAATDSLNVLNATTLLSSTISNSAGTGTVTGWRNGTSFGPTTYSTASITSQQGLLGVSRSGAGAGSLSFYYGGGINEIIIFNSVLSVSQRQRVEGYLAWKWGVQSSLPTSHPYYKFSP